MGTDLRGRSPSAARPPREPNLRPPALLRPPLRRRAAGLLAGAALGLSAGLLTGHAGAQPDTSAAQIGAAREVGIEGLKLAEEGRCPEAIEKLAQAERLYSAPSTLGRLGECRVKVGKLVLGTENLQRVVKTVLAPNAPPAFRAAQERAQRVLDEALPRLARLRVTVAGTGSVAPELKLDGEPVAGALLGVDMPADPGPHRIELTAAGFLAETRSVTLAEGGREAVAVTMRPDPAAAARPAASAPASAAPTTAPPAAPPAAEASPTRRYVSYGLLGVGAAGLVVGGVFGLLAVSRKGDLDDQCANKVCPLRADSDYERARSAGLVSTIGIGVGAVSAGVGLALLLTGGSSSSTSGRPARGLTVGAGPAPAGLGLGGAF